MNSDTGELELKGGEPEQPKTVEQIKNAGKVRKLTPQEVMFNNIVKRMKEAQGLDEDAETFRVLHPITDYMSEADIATLPANQQARIAAARAKRARKQKRRNELARKGAFYVSQNG